MNPQTYIIYTVSRKFKYLKKTIYKKCDEINLFDHSCRGIAFSFLPILDIGESFSFFVNVILTALMLYNSNGCEGRRRLISRPQSSLLGASVSPLLGR